jgi:hypothetical protein
MENQHRQISGYGELEQEAIDAMNELKAHESQIINYLASLARVHKQHLHAPDGMTNAYDGRWLAIAKTHIQQGFMAANRAVARPEEL